MVKNRNGTELRNLKRIAIITILNILHVTAHNKLEEKEKLFNILLWTSTGIPFTMAQENFIASKCQFQNCFITRNVSMLSDVTKFDAILFDAVALKEEPDIPFPKNRSKYQRYVLASTESSVHYPITSEYNNFFNWTWTYKLDSDIVFAQIAIKDKDGKVVGPKKEMHWLPEAKMKTTSNDIINKLADKTITAIWITKNCDPESQSHRYIRKMQEELKMGNRSVDIYGPCENMNNTMCVPGFPKFIKECEALIESNYYFYLVFENVVSEDFVSKQLLTPLNHFAVPIVFGGANYTRYVGN